MPRRSILGKLALVCLAALFASQAAVTMAAATEDKTIPVVGTRIAPLEAYSDILERPLFSPARRPGNIQASGVVSGDNGVRYLRLVGIIIEDSTRTALLQDLRAEEKYQLSEGERFRGWSVASITGRRVTLVKGDENWVLNLRYDRRKTTKSKAGERNGS